MKKSKSNIIIIGLTFSILIGLYFLGFGLYPLFNKKMSLMTYKEAGEESQKIAEKHEKQQNIINNSMTEEEKEEEDKNKSDAYKMYEKLTSEEKAKIEVIPKKENVPISKLDEIIKQQEEQKQKEETKKEEKQEESEQKEDQEKEEEKQEEDIEVEPEKEEIPRYFDLMDKINIKTRDQGERGLCWSFASLSALETHLQLKTGKDYDFSRQHLNYMTSNLLYGERVIDQGGNFQDFENYVMQSGVVLEEEVPYDKDYDEKEYSTFINKEPIITVTETVEFPTINKYSQDFTEEELETFRTAVKRHIMNNGGLYAGITHYCFAANQKNCFISKNDKDVVDWNYIPDHAITIIGWNDDYPREKFAYNEGAMMPEKNGAYIALNSWGNRNYDEKRDTKNGVFYISYEDIYAEIDLEGIISTSLDEDYAIEFDNIKSERIKQEINEKYYYAIKEISGKKYITNLVLKRIESLDLSNSDTIYLDDLKYFKNLKNLSLKNCNITSIEQLPELPYLETLDLSYNNITNIDSLRIKGLIRELNLSHNKIQSINGFDYTYEKSIYTQAKIDLSDNNIETIKAYITNEETEIYIDLHNNQIKDISSINSNNTAKLRLNVSGNKGITGYSDYLSLYELNLADCDLTTLEDITYVDTLNLSGNKNLDFDLSKANISNLILKNMNLKSLEDKKINLASLFSLDVSNNELENLNGIPETITTLDASNNHIKNITMLNNVKANRIKLDNNDITTSQIQELALNDVTTILSLKNNKIEDVSNMNTNNLTILDLSGNTGIKGYGNLRVKELSINKCGLQEIEKINSSIETLYIDENNIKTLEPIKNGNNLSYLSIKKNTEKIEGNLSTNTKLRTLDLQDTKLDSSFKVNNSLEKLIISYECPNVKTQYKKGNIELVNAEITDEFLKKLIENEANITIKSATIKYNIKPKNKEIDIKGTNLYNRVANLRNLVYVEDGGYISRDREKVVIEKDNKKSLNLMYDNRNKIILEVSFENNNGLLNSIKNIISNIIYGG